MNEQEIKKRELLIQLGLIIIFIFLLIISLIIIEDLILINDGYDYDGNIYNKAKKKEKIVVIAFLLISAFTLILLYDKYRKNPNKSNFYSLIIILLVSIFEFIKFYNSIKKDYNYNKVMR